MRKRQCNKTLLVNSPGKHPVDSIQNWKLFLFLLEDAFVLRALLGYWNKWDLSVPNMFVNEPCSTLLPGQIEASYSYYTFLKYIFFRSPKNPSEIQATKLLLCSITLPNIYKIELCGL